MSSVEPETPVIDSPNVVDDNNIKNNSSDKEEVSESKPVDVEQATSNFQERAKNYLIEQSSHIVIPSFAKWFNMNEINTIETKSFPDFFPKGDNPRSIYKTETVYKNMRDFMINAYRINPLEYLTITAVRRNLAGDVTSIIRVHQFLEKWGLINYHIDPRTKSSIVGPQYTGHFQVTLDTPKGLVPFIPEHKEIINDNVNKLPTPTQSVEPELKEEKEKEEKKVEGIPLNLEVRRNIYDVSSDVRNSQNTIVQYFCNICGKDSSEVRYHNLRVKSTSNNPNSTLNNASLLCTTCFEQGLFPSNFQSSDFLKLKQWSNDDWSQQEVLLLLEGIEMYGSYDVNANGINNANINSNANGQWDKISEFVGTKSREQCLVKFIQLPIEDRYLNKLVEPKKGSEKDIKRETLIQDIVKEIISKQEGEELIKVNANKNLEDTLKEETNLVNQITELTLSKIDLKLKNMSILESNLIKLENQLNLERKQLLFERWSNFEKINNLKRERPELTELLNDLLTPIKISEVNKSISNFKTNDSSNKNEMEVDSNDASAENTNLPISVTEPKRYQFWSC